MSKQWPQGAEVGEILRGNDEIGLYKPDDTPSVIDGSLNKKKTMDVFASEIQDLQATSELSLGLQTASFSSLLFIRKVSDDVVRFTCPWYHVPTQASSINIDFGTGGALQIVGGGSSLTIDNTYTEGSPTIGVDRVEFQLTKVGAFAGLPSSTMLIMLSSGAIDTKLVLS